LDQIWSADIWSRPEQLSDWIRDNQYRTLITSDQPGSGQDLNSLVIGSGITNIEHKDHVSGFSYGHPFSPIIETNGKLLWKLICYVFVCSPRIYITSGMLTKVLFSWFSCWAIIERVDTIVILYTLSLKSWNKWFFYVWEYSPRMSIPPRIIRKGLFSKEKNMWSLLGAK
jgi:hypothetical protein